MKLENQVVNLELAQKLKELGVPQESLFYHYPVRKAGLPTGEYAIEYWGTKPESDMYSAFTVAELGEMLPTTYEKSAYHEKNIPSNNEYKHLFLISYGKQIQSKPPIVGEVFTNEDYTSHYVSSFVGRLSAPEYLHLQKAGVNFVEPTEANARAKMLIYLIENNLLDPKTLSV